MKRPELMAPAGDLVSLKAALDTGADAIYFGTKDLNMRATAKNFEISQIKEVVSECKRYTTRCYLTLNALIYEHEIEHVKTILKAAIDAGVDGVICSDMAVLEIARDYGLKVILSTQTSVSNSKACNWYKSKGVWRIVLARECSLEQIKEIKSKTDIELEAFVHGAMCVSISGRCLISQFLFCRSANRGDCLQPCRRSYIIKDPEEDNELELKERYVMSPKDLCTLPFIDKMIDAGIDCFKIEGRGRSPEYVKTVTSAYRKAIDAHFEGKLDENLKKELIEELKTVFNRGFSEGFYLGKPVEEWAESYGSQATTKKHYLGFVRNFYKKISVAEMVIESDEIKVGDTIMFQGSTTGVHEQEIKSLQKNHVNVENAKKGEFVAIKTDTVIRPRDKVFKIYKKEI